MNRVRSGDAEIAYEVLGDGSPLVLLHPFPANHELWLPAAQALTSRYRVILPDLRAHGESEAGEGPVTMEKHASDIARVLDDAGVGRSSAEFRSAATSCLEFGAATAPGCRPWPYAALARRRTPQRAVPRV